MQDAPHPIPDDNFSGFGWPELREALSVWPRLALYSFGSSAVQLSAMYRILVTEKRWISEERFLNALNYCMAIPGPEAQQLAIYVGWITHRVPGALIAGTLFLLPGVLFMMALCFGYVAGGDSQASGALLFGIKPGVLAVTIGSTVQIWGQLLRTRLMAVIAVLAFIVTFFFNVTFLIAIIGAALLGLCGGFGGFGKAALKRPPHFFHTGARSTDIADVPERALPAYTRLTAQGLLRACAWCALLCMGPLILFVMLLGADNVFSQISILASKAALLIFGGPYGATNYVLHQAVDVYHWLSRDEIADGIAMAELGPGPSILLLQFAGFVAAYRNPGALSPLLAGTAGGVLTAWMIFVPTFAYIFLIAPFIETFRNHQAIRTTLSAITGAVVGILVTFTVRFFVITIFREHTTLKGFGSGFDVPQIASIDWWSLAICVATGVAVFRFRLGIAPAIALSCLAGVALVMLGVSPR